MNARAIFAIVRKDLKVVIQNKGVVMPIIIAPLILFGILPWLVNLLPSLDSLLGSTSTSIEEIQALISRMPAGFRQALAVFDDSQLFIGYILVFMMAPFFLLIPLYVSSVVAADSFAGEKERKTMEALLYTPTTDQELFIAKLLSGWIAAITVALGSFVIYVITANAAAWPLMNRIFFPNTMWLVLISWVVPAVPGLGLGLMVIISARAQGFQDANQIGSVVVLPVILLFVTQMAGVMYFNSTFLLILGLVLWLLDGLMVWLGSRSFRRSRLLGA